METNVYIFNMSEDVWPFIAAISDTKSRLSEIDENKYLSDIRLFRFATEDDDLLFVSPVPISETFLAYFKQLFGNNKTIRVLVPQKHTGVICDDILADQKLMDELVNAANSSKKLSITCYATTFPFLELVRVLREKGLTISTPESPEEEDAWTVNFYGSKSGIRQLGQQSTHVEPDFQMPNGLICMGIEDAARIAAKKYVKEQGVVLKTNKGHSGMGVLLFRPGDLPAEYKQCEEKVLQILKKDKYWDLFPIIIEDLVSINSGVGGGCPNVEFRIAKTGKIDMLFYGGMRVTQQGVFQGMEIHHDVLSDRVAAQLVDTGFFIAERYAASGYRGFFDVDFVAGKNGQLYVTESNVRSTGGTHVYYVAEKLFGKDFLYLTYLVSDNGYDLKGKTFASFSALEGKMRPILFDKVTREGMVLVSENMLSFGKLAYIIFGKTKKRANEIEEEMKRLLE